MSTPISYLELCKRFVRDLGINAGTFSAVTSAGQVEAMVAGFIRDSDLYIQDLWFDWDFLWETATANVTAGDKKIDRASDMASLNVGSVVINRGTATGFPLEFMPWPQFSRTYRTSAAVVSDTPQHFSTRPDPSLAISIETEWASSDPVYYYEYWKDPVPMTADDSISAITKYGEESHRLIMARAKLMWAERENVPEVMNSAAAEYEDLLPRLEAMAHGQQRRQEYMLGPAGEPLVIVTP